MNKLEKIEREAQKAREKIAAFQTVLKQIDGKRTEQENLQIVQQVRALKLSRDELYAFLDTGTLPPALAGAISTTATEPDGGRLPEVIHSRRERPRRTPDVATEPEPTKTETIPNFEREGMKNEEN